MLELSTSIILWLKFWYFSHVSHHFASLHSRRQLDISCSFASMIKHACISFKGESYFCTIA